MRTKASRIAYGLIAVLLGLTMIGTYMANGLVAFGATEDPEKTASTLSVSDAINGIENDTDLSKEETVYVITDSNGNADDVIVSDWIKNSGSQDTVSDTSDLSDVQVVKGDASYSMDTGSAMTWTTNGDDIYYQGKSSRDVPVDMQVSYQLNGSPVTVDELAGKEGTVTLRIDFTNNAVEYVNGSRTYVPFLMLSGMLLDDETCSNIKVTNGRLVDDGSHSLIVGFAMPGLEEDLGTSELDIPDYIEVTFDTTDFELSTIMTVASCNFFSELDPDAIGDLSDLQSQLDQMSSAMNQLVTGGTELSDAMNQLVAATSYMAGQVSVLYDKTAELNAGAQSLNQGVSTLDTGLETITANNDALNSGAEQTFNSLLEQVETDSGFTTVAQLEEECGVQGVDFTTLSDTGETSVDLTIDNYSTQLQAMITALDEGGQVETAIKQGQILPQILTTMGIDENTYNAMTDEQKAAIQEQVDLYYDQNTKSTVTEARTSLSSTLSQLESYDSFYEGLDAYTAGVSGASEGASQLSEGSQQIADGTQAMQDGVAELNEGTQTLNSSVAAITAGASELSAGLTEFNDEAVQKLVDMGEEAQQYLDRLDNIVQAARDYNNFSGLQDDMKGNVNFMYKTDVVKSTDTDQDTTEDGSAAE